MSRNDWATIVFQVGTLTLAFGVGVGVFYLFPDRGWAPALLVFSLAMLVGYLGRIAERGWRRRYGSKE